MPLPHRQPGLLIAVEGLEGSGRSRLADVLARWVERRGRRVHLVPWDASRFVRRAARDPRTRPALSRRVAELLVAAEAAHSTADQVARPVADGAVVVADRYAWTAIARGVAGGDDPAWLASLYAHLPRPDLVLHVRTPVGSALRAALEERPGDAGGASAIRADLEAFLVALARAYDDLAAGDPGLPWQTHRLSLDGGSPLDENLRVVRAALRPLLDGASTASAAPAVPAAR